MKVGFGRGLTSLTESNGVAQGLTSRGQSNGFARDLTRSPKAIVQWLIRNSTSGAFGSLCQAPSLCGTSEGSANEAADVRLESFGLSTGLDVRLSSVEASAAADGSTLLTALSLSKWSAFPEGAIASILTSASSVEPRGAFGGEGRSEISRVRGRSGAI